MGRYVGYGLRLMSNLPADGKPLENKIYIGKSGDKLRYKVISPGNKIAEGALDIKVDGDLTPEILESFKEQILEEILSRGDISRCVIVDDSRHTTPVLCIDDKLWIRREDGG